MNLADKIRAQHIDNIMQTLAAKPHRKREEGHPVNALR